MVKCPYCHFENEDGALFCEQCKSDLAGLPVPEPAHAAPAVVPEAVPAVEPYHVLPEPVPAFPAAEPVVAEAVVEAVPVDAVPVEAVPVEAVPVDSGHVVEAIPVEAEAAHVPEVVAPVADELPTEERPQHPAAAPTVEHAAQPAPAAPAVAAPSPAALPPNAEPRLLVLRGQKRNVEYPIYEGLNFIGRADEKPVDIDLEDQEPPDRVWCSRQHACISFENDQLEIEDLNSSNGTYVNRTRVYPGQKRPLAVNDIIQIGNVQLKVIA
jgi:hypothetical protein